MRNVTQKGVMMSEQAKLDECLKMFTDAMRHRIQQKKKQGWYGWDSQGFNEAFGRRMLSNAISAYYKRNYFDLVDTANLCMFLYYQKAVKGIGKQ